MAFPLQVTNCPAQVRAGGVLAAVRHSVKCSSGVGCHQTAPLPPLLPLLPLPPPAAAAAAACCRSPGATRRPWPSTPAQDLARTNRVYVAQHDPVAALGYIQLGGM